jgi:hypothetical protein
VRTRANKVVIISIEVSPVRRLLENKEAAGFALDPDG